MFNPEEYTLSRENNFAQIAVPGLSAPIVQFVHGNQQTLEMELFLDTYEAHRAGSRVLNEAGDDVRKLAQQGHRADGHRALDARAAGAAVHLGSLSFTCVLARATQRFIMFMPDGTPVRARLQVTFNEYSNAELEAKEVKRETADYTKVHVVGRARRWRDRGAGLRRPALWRPIALRNRHRRSRGASRVGARARWSRSCRTAIRESGEVYAVSAALRYRAGVPRRHRRRAGAGGAARLDHVGVACRPGSKAPIASSCTRQRGPALARPSAAASSTASIAFSLGYAPGSARADVRRRDRRPQRGVPRERHADPHRRRAGSAPRACSAATSTRWFAIPMPSYGNLPIPDVAVAGLVTAEHGLIPIVDPVAAALAVLLGGAQVAIALDDPDGGQKIIRKQDGESDFDFLARIARENGWEMVVDHGGPARRIPAALLVAAGSASARRHAQVRAAPDRLHAAHHHGRADRRRQRADLDAGIKTEFTCHRRLGLGPPVARHQHQPGFGIPEATGEEDERIHACWASR